MAGSFRLCGTVFVAMDDDGVFALEARCSSASGSLSWEEGYFSCRYEGDSLGRMRQLAVPGAAVLVSGRLSVDRGKVILVVTGMGFLASGEVPSGKDEVNSVMAAGFVTRSADEGSLGLSVPAAVSGGDLSLDVFFPGMSRAEALLASKYAVRGHFVRVSGRLGFLGGGRRDVVIVAGSVDYCPPDART